MNLFQKISLKSFTRGVNNTNFLTVTKKNGILRRSFKKAIRIKLIIIDQTLEQNDLCILTILRFILAVIEAMMWMLR